MHLGQKAQPRCRLPAVLLGDLSPAVVLAAHFVLVDSRDAGLLFCFSDVLSMPVAVYPHCILFHLILIAGQRVAGRGDELHVTAGGTVCSMADGKWDTGSLQHRVCRSAAKTTPRCLAIN